MSEIIEYLILNLSDPNLPPMVLFCLSIFILSLISIKYFIIIIKYFIIIMVSEANRVKLN
jgi:hypothetical protein